MMNSFQNAWMKCFATFLLISAAYSVSWGYDGGVSPSPTPTPSWGETQEQRWANLGPTPTPMRIAEAGNPTPTNTPTPTPNCQRSGVYSNPGQLNSFRQVNRVYSNQTPHSLENPGHVNGTFSVTYTSGSDVCTYSSIARTVRGGVWGVCWYSIYRNDNAAFLGLTPSTRHAYAVRLGPHAPFSLNAKGFSFESGMPTSISVGGFGISIGWTVFGGFWGGTETGFYNWGGPHPISQGHFNAPGGTITHAPNTPLTGQDLAYIDAQIIAHAPTSITYMWAEGYTNIILNCLAYQSGDWQWQAVQ